MGSAIYDLQKAILDSNQSLTQLLRRTKLIAAKLNLEDVEKWVDLELDGYPNEIDPPKYRWFKTESVEIRNPIRGWEFAGHYGVKVPTRQPIAEVEGLSSSERLFLPMMKNLPVSDGTGGSFGSDWPQRAVFGGNKFKHILEAVRNELLKWAAELEKRGIIGEDMSFDEKEKRLATNVHIEKFTGVFGNVTNSQVAVNDYSSICKLLIDQNVSKNERRELEDILEELKAAPPDKKPPLIARAESWLVKHGPALGTGAEAVGKFIKGLAGHPSSHSQ